MDCAAKLRLKTWSFAYEPGKPVLNDISLLARPGTVTALVGPSGAGKSTLIGLVAAFYAPTDRPRSRGWRRSASSVRLDSYRAGQLGVVLQDTFPVRRNHSRERGLLAARRQRLRPRCSRPACAIARVDEFAERFEQKYDTVVGERGVKLSLECQKQQVSIARARSWPIRAS